MAVKIEHEIGSKRYHISLDEFERMVERGVFVEGARIELMRGELVEMSPIGEYHIGCVMRLQLLLHEQVGRKANVLVQSSLRLPDDTKPYPDLCLLRWRDDSYIRKHPAHEDVLLVIEVADTSLSHDRKDKASMYAEAAIPEYWIVNLREGVIEVYTEPAAGKYSQVKQVGRGEMLPLPGGLEGSIRVDEVFMQGR